MTKDRSATPHLVILRNAMTKDLLKCRDNGCPSTTAAIEQQRRWHHSWFGMLWGCSLLIIFRKISVMPPRADLWTREQTIIAFNLYCEIPFGQAHSRNAKVQRVAKLIGRTPGAVARKLGNFGSLDPELKARGIKGLGNRSKLDEEIWNEFHDNWNKQAYESTLLIAKYENKPLEKLIEVDIENLPKGEDKIRSVKTRVYQSFFRKAVLAEYDEQCCITGLKIPQLLVASHIKPWKDDEHNRTNPKNGLCLNALHDKAFDTGFITVMPNYTIAISKQLSGLSDEVIDHHFMRYNKQPIHKPHKFLPEKDFLEYHYESVFRK